MRIRNGEQRMVFIWQAILIVLPLAVLAVIGFLFLRQDRVVARHEAEDRAQTIANEVLSKAWAALQGIDEPGFGQPWTFRVGARGNRSEERRVGKECRAGWGRW